MTIEVTDELLELVESYKHYGTEYGAINIARYICDELDKEEK